jgi:hypothetical protein
MLIRVIDRVVYLAKACDFLDDEIPIKLKVLESMILSTKPELIDTDLVAKKLFEILVLEDNEDIPYNLDEKADKIMEDDLYEYLGIVKENPAITVVKEKVEDEEVLDFLERKLEELEGK